jgi:hypothetical protein
MKLADFREYRKNTLLGFFTLHIHGLRIKDCTLHEKAGRRWFGFPGRPLIDQDGRVVRDEKSKTQYVQIIEVDKAHADELQRRVAEASYELIAADQPSAALPL